MTGPNVRVLIDAATIAARNAALAGEIRTAVPEGLLVVAVLKGSFAKRWSGMTFHRKAVTLEMAFEAKRSAVGA